MPLRLSDRVLPDQQRRTLVELTEDLDLTVGDSESKRSAFWTMLALSAVIATAGVLSDSTATVIGAMIIAPLATPIMGIALGIAKRDSITSRHAMRFVTSGAALVVIVGAAFALLVPSSYDLLGNSQISGRTSPGLLDLVAAVATGFAGAVAMARRDVAAVLPGVAIAISWFRHWRWWACASDREHSPWLLVPSYFSSRICSPSYSLARWSSLLSDTQPRRELCSRVRGGGPT